MTSYPVVYKLILQASYKQPPPDVSGSKQLSTFSDDQRAIYTTTTLAGGEYTGTCIFLGSAGHNQRL